jgi:hypothetical protein
MQYLTLRNALNPLLFCALVFGVRGFGRRKYAIEFIYGLVVSLLLLTCLVYSTISYFKYSIILWHVELKSTLYFTICVEFFIFFIVSFTSISIIIYIIKGNKDLNNVTCKLNIHCKILHCEEYISKELRRFAIMYVFSACFIYIIIIIVQSVMWSYLGVSYMITCITFYTIKLQESMVEGQMLAILHAKKSLFYVINSKLQVSIVYYMWSLKNFFYL